MPKKTDWNHHLLSYPQNHFLSFVVVVIELKSVLLLSQTNGGDKAVDKNPSGEQGKVPLKTVHLRMLAEGNHGESGNRFNGRERQHQQNHLDTFNAAQGGVFVGPGSV